MTAKEQIVQSRAGTLATAAVTRLRRDQAVVTVGRATVTRAETSAYRDP